MKIYSLKQIETPRLLIRPIERGDEIPINEAIHRSLDALKKWMPWASDPRFETTKKFVELSLRNWRSVETTEFPLPLVAILKKEKKLISVSGFNERSDITKPYFEIGYWIDSSYQGQGLITELVIALTKYTFDELKATRLQIAIQVDNIKSIAVAKRCGFIEEARLKNYCIDCIYQIMADSYLYARYDAFSLPEVKIQVEYFPTIPDRQIKKLQKTKTKKPEILPLLETNRLTIISPSLEVAHEVHHALSASLKEVGPRFTWTNPQANLTQMKNHMLEGQEAAADIKTYDHLFYLVRHKEQKHFLGEVWLKIHDWHRPSMTVNYWFDSTKTGHGFATEAVHEVLRFALTDLGARRIQLHAAKTNTKSINLAKRLGFKYEGTLKNH